MVIVGALLKQFGPTSGGEGPGPGPTLPTFTLVDNQNGTVTVTISGSSVGANNVVYAQHVSEIAWSLVGSRVGDGSLVVTLPNFGRYYFYVSSSLNTQSVASPIQSIFLKNSGDLSGLEHSPAEIVQKLLIDLGEASNPEDEEDWPAHVSILPAKPQQVMTCNDTVGMKQGRIQVSGRIPSHPGVQILLRSDDPNGGFVKLTRISVVLSEDVVRVTVNLEGSVYLVQAITQIGNVHSLGRESASAGGGSVSNCQLYSLNLLVSVKQIA